MMTQHHLKENVKIMALLAERDDAMHECNIALAEKRAAIAERDMAILQRDAAIAERNNAVLERDNALAALHYARENGVNSNCMSECSPATRGIKHSHHHHQQQHLQHLQTQSPFSDGHYNDTREMHVTEAFPSSTDSDGIMKSQKAKRRIKESNVQASPSKKSSKSSRNSRKKGGEDLNKQVTIAKSDSDWRDEVVGDDLNKHASRTKYYGWKGQDLGLNQVSFDELAMPVPVCSCTGKYRQCYKWGNGGWQSSCCTTTMSMYPLPVMPNKRHARMNGRKMSGSAFRKLLSRLAVEGYDLSMSVDLKDHWAKHGTNRYITIK